MLPIFSEYAVGSFNLAFMVNKVRWENLKESFLVGALVLILSFGVLWMLVKNMLSRKLSVILLLCIALGDIIWLDVQIVNPSAASLRSPVFTDSRVVNRAFRHDEITRFGTHIVCLPGIHNLAYPHIVVRFVRHSYVTTSTARAFGFVPTLFAKGRFAKIVG